MSSLLPQRTFVRPLRPADLEVVLEIERRAYTFPWSRANFIDSLAAGYLAEQRVDEAGMLIGYWVAMPGVDEMHLLNLTVVPEQQCLGHGRAMVARLVALARQRGDCKLWLEVREGNAAARRLYGAIGFAEVGRRRAYYPALDDRREDAVVMSLELRG